jgi:hypothetical protein
MLGSKTEELTGGWRRMHNEEVCVFVSLVEYKKGIQTTENYVGEYAISMKEKMNECRSLLDI